MSYKVTIKIIFTSPTSPIPTIYNENINREFEKIDIKVRDDMVSNFDRMLELTEKYLDNLKVVDTDGSA